MISHFTIDLRHLPEGMYFVKIGDESNREIVRIVKE